MMQRTDFQNTQAYIENLVDLNRQMEENQQQMTPVIQGLMEKDDELATQIYEDIGVYLAYTLPFYAKFYDMKHVLLLGRVMGGKGGNIVLDTCRKVLDSEYPQFKNLDISLPDESSRRVGQSIAAASLPADVE